MEEKTLSDLLEEDKELVLENISRDRTPEAAQAAAEKELDRILYRYNEDVGSETLAAGAKTALQTVRSSLPLLEAVSEVREWQRTDAAREKKPSVRPVGILLALLGALLVLGSVLVLLKNTAGALTLGALLPPVLGAAGLFGGGVLLLPRGKAAPAARLEKRQEFLVDGAGVYRALRGALLVADKNLRELRETAALSESLSQDSEGLTGEETELFSTLLEAAYARRGESGDAEEIIGGIRYYLHRRNVETIEYTKEKESWFELLPARRSGTIRPALAFNGRLIKKGLASSAEG